MQRIQVSFTVKDISLFKTKILDWAQQYDTLVWLDSNEHSESYSQYESVLAISENNSITTDYKNAFEKLKKYQSRVQDYIFGYLSYDLKNDLEQLCSENYDGLHFPDLYFFQPKKLIFISKKQITFKYLPTFKHKDIKNDFCEIKNYKPKKTKVKNKNILIKSRINEASYLKKVQTILKHIQRGNIYEVNFCIEFYSENSIIEPIYVYKNLNLISKPPFATFFKHNNNYLLSASPERYLKKIGTKIISQPIKGTSKRSNYTKEDLLLKEKLFKNSKEKSENIMIVDLVRNDLSKIAVRGSVKVEELCKISSFKQVHQMTSTITSEINKTIHPVDIIKNTYPMGSMTGMPKIAAMKIIETEEETKRGLYSGSIGYFTPSGNFDFNVIIRSILYNQKEKYVSYSVGSAITLRSIPEKEFEECLLKAKAMHEVLV